MIGTILQLGSLGVSFAKGMVDTYEGAKREREASEALSDYKRQDLTNAYENMSVPTLGIQLRTQEANRTAASLSKQASQAGSRGVVGMSSQIADYTTQTMASIGADFQKAQFQLDLQMAADEARIQGMQEQRERDDILGLNAEIASGRSQRRSAFDTVTSTMASGAEMGGSLDNGIDNLFANGAFGNNIAKQQVNPPIDPSKTFNEIPNDINYNINPVT